MKTIYPLRTGYRILYWVCIVGAVGLVSYMLTQGRMAFPGIIAVAGVIALIKDDGVKKRTRDLESQAVQPPPIPPAPPTGQP